FVFSRHPVLDSIGVYFSGDDFLYEKKYFKSIVPQLWSVNGISADSLKDYKHWQKVEFVYTATGEESFISIGVFKRIDYKIDKSDFRNDYYFFLDDVSLTPMDEHETMCPQADSIKQVIYNDNVRHDYLQKRMYYFRKQSPQIMPLPPTRMPVKQKIDTLII